MKRLRTMLATAVVLLCAVAVSSSNDGVWLPVMWNGCDPVVVPWKSNVTETMSGLRRAGVMGAQRTGVVEQGTLTISFNDGKRNEIVQMVFDTQGKYIGAATSHSCTTTENARACVSNLVGRLIVGGAKVISRSPASTDLRMTCNGTDLSVTVGINEEEPLKPFISVMVEPSTTRTASN